MWSSWNLDVTLHLSLAGTHQVLVGCSTLRVRHGPFMLGTLQFAITTSSTLAYLALCIRVESQILLSPLTLLNISHPLKMTTWHNLTADALYFLIRRSFT
jgi:hypothetical protein